MCSACTRNTRDALVAMLTLAMIPPFQIHNGDVRDLNAERIVLVRLLESLAIGAEGEYSAQAEQVRAMGEEVRAIPVEQLGTLAGFTQRAGTLFEQMHRIFSVNMAERALTGDADAQHFLSLEESLGIVAEAKEYSATVREERRERASLN